jgi:hypothetical protein
MSLKPLAIVVLFVLSGLFAGCGGSTKGGLLWIVLASKDSGGVDVLVDGRVVAANRPFGSLINNIATSGDRATVTFRRTGTSTVLRSATITLGGDGVLMILAGKLTPRTGEPGLQVLTFAQDRSLPQEDTWEVRAINVAAETPGRSDFYLNRVNQDQFATNAVFLNLEFGGLAGYVSRRTIEPKRIIVTESGDRNNVRYDGLGDTVDFRERDKKTFLLIDGTAPGLMSRPIILDDRF